MALLCSWLSATTKHAQIVSPRQLLQHPCGCRWDFARSESWLVPWDPSHHPACVASCCPFSTCELLILSTCTQGSPSSCHEVPPPYRPASVASTSGGGSSAKRLSAELASSYTRKQAPLAGKLRAIAGPNPLYSPPTPSCASVCKVDPGLRTCAEMRMIWVAAALLSGPQTPEITSKTLCHMMGAWHLSEAVQHAAVLRVL